VLALKRTRERPVNGPVDREPSPAALCEVTLTTTEGGLLLAIRGALDASSMPALAVQIDQLQCTPCEKAVLDLCKVDVADHVGLNAIAGLAHYVAARGGRLVIRCSPGAIRGLLISTGLGAHIEDPTNDAPPVEPASPAVVTRSS